MADKHWESVYTTKGDADVSWTQAEPRLSLSLIGEVCPAGTVVDVGAGTSPLVDRLLDRGYAVAALDTSAAALARSQSRLGARANGVRWIVADVTASPELGTYDVWHDRAVFHFLTRPSERAAYRELLVRTVPAGGHAVIATFAPDGPRECSGLPVRRYDGPALAMELGPAFQLLKSVPEAHHTPWGARQPFQYSVFRCVATRPG
jgi:SAM-dependent methyltransferase